MGEETTETTSAVEQDTTTLLTDSTEASADVDTPDVEAPAADDKGTEDYTDFTVPEGVVMDEAVLGKANDLFKEVGLTQEQAQKFIDFQASQNQTTETGRIESFNATQKEWVDQIKADKDIGGDNFSKSIANAKEALDKFGTPELTQMLNESGMGSNPELVRLLSRVGELTREDNPNNGDPKHVEKSAADILYPQS